MTTAALAAFAVVLVAAGPAAAQSAGEAEFNAAAGVKFSAVAAKASADTKSEAVPPIPSAVPPRSCGEPGKELERDFVLTVPGSGMPVPLTYAGCSQEGRNDYLPGYTERNYNGSGGYGMTLVTEHGDGAFPKQDEDKRAQALISKGKDWVARMGARDHKALISGESFYAEGYSVKAAKPAMPSYPACEANLPKASYGGNELWLATKTKAYYYREDCDICAELDSCDLATHRVKTEITAHMVNCSDLDAYRKGADVVYDNCTR